MRLANPLEAPLDPTAPAESSAEPGPCDVAMRPRRFKAEVRAVKVSSRKPARGG